MSICTDRHCVYSSPIYESKCDSGLYTTVRVVYGIESFDCMWTFRGDIHVTVLIMCWIQYMHGICYIWTSINHFDDDIESHSMLTKGTV